MIFICLRLSRANTKSRAGSINAMHTYIIRLHYKLAAVCTIVIVLKLIQLKILREIKYFKLFAMLFLEIILINWFKIINIGPILNIAYSNECTCMKYNLFSVVISVTLKFLIERSHMSVETF